MNAQNEIDYTLMSIDRLMDTLMESSALLEAATSEREWEELDSMIASVRDEIRSRTMRPVA